MPGSRQRLQRYGRCGSKICRPQIKKFSRKNRVVYITDTSFSTFSSHSRPYLETSPFGSHLRELSDYRQRVKSEGLNNNNHSNNNNNNNAGFKLGAGQTTPLPSGMCTYPLLVNECHSTPVSTPRTYTAPPRTVSGHCGVRRAPDYQVVVVLSAEVAGDNGATGGAHRTLLAYLSNLYFQLNTGTVCQPRFMELVVQTSPEISLFVLGLENRRHTSKDGECRLRSHVPSHHMASYHGALLLSHIGRSRRVLGYVLHIHLHNHLHSVRVADVSADILSLFQHVLLCWSVDPGKSTRKLLQSVCGVGPLNGGVYRALRNLNVGIILARLWFWGTYIKSKSDWSTGLLLVLIQDLYVSLVRPILEFSSVVWSFYQERQISSFDENGRCEANIWMLTFRRCSFCCGFLALRTMMDTAFLFKLLNGLIDCPEILHPIDFHVPRNARQAPLSANLPVLLHHLKTQYFIISDANLESKWSNKDDVLDQELKFPGHLADPGYLVGTGQRGVEIKNEQNRMLEVPRCEDGAEAAHHLVGQSHSPLPLYSLAAFFCFTSRFQIAIAVRERAMMMVSSATGLLCRRRRRVSGTVPALRNTGSGRSDP
ncbi:hypothetical protein J6590_011412 [Homalodisca vitripennis]|nr:hypothetical protein J6590_011412 [Homalodisca vitripennis]